MSERVLVTGGSGLLGRQAITELLDNGYDVVSVDRVKPTPPITPALPSTPGARFVQTDLSDIGEIAGSMKGCEAVIHLGAIPTPYANPDEVVFTNNTGATFAVLQAASLLGIKRLAIASSVSSYGMAWSPTMLHPLYVPIDEAHPMRNHDPYGLSKEVDERTAQMFVRRERMSIACMRFHWIGTREEQLEWPKDESDERLDVSAEARNCWGYIDIRDAARSLRLAIEVAKDAPFGFEPFNIVARDTLVTLPTEATLRKVAPETEIRVPIAGNDSGFDISKAKRILGWEPLHSWRDPE